MSQPRALSHAALAAAARALAERDADLARLLERHGAPPLGARRPGFPTLVRIMLEQQVSLGAARTLFRRVSAELGGITPERIAAAGEHGLRAAGLTRQKARYCHGLAGCILAGRLDLGAVARAPDPLGRQALLAVPGLGPWSVDIYYLMALRRPDVWPTGDLALADALRQVKRLRTHPTRAQQERLAGRWAPWRSVAARLLWQHYLAARGRLG